MPRAATPPPPSAPHEQQQQQQTHYRHHHHHHHHHSNQRFQSLPRERRNHERDCLSASPRSRGRNGNYNARRTSTPIIAASGTSTAPAPGSAENEARDAFNGCDARRCRRERVGCYAIVLGIVSLAWLLAALVSDHWVLTEETVSIRRTPPDNTNMVTGRAASYDRIRFNVGLWKVCPALTLKQHRRKYNTDAESIDRCALNHLKTCGGRPNTCWGSTSLPIQVAVKTKAVIASRTL